MLKSTFQSNARFRKMWIWLHGREKCEGDTEKDGRRSVGEVWRWAVTVSSPVSVSKPTVARRSSAGEHGLISGHYFTSTIDLKWFTSSSFFSYTSLPVHMVRCEECLSRINWFNLLTAQQLCDGTETFEKIVGVNISLARLTPLFSDVGGPVTAQCNNRSDLLTGQ